MLRYIFGLGASAKTTDVKPQIEQPIVQTPVVETPVVEEPVKHQPLPNRIHVKSTHTVSSIAYDCNYMTEFYATLLDGAFKTEAGKEIPVTGVNNGWKLCPGATLYDGEVPASILTSKETSADVKAKIYTPLGNVNGSITLRELPEDKGFNKKIHSKTSLFGVDIVSETTATPVNPDVTNGTTNRNGF